MRTFLMGLALASMGCVTARPVIGPDGTRHVAIKCGTNGVGCYERAGRACPAGYEVVDQQGGIVATTSGAASTNTMLIKCKPAMAARRQQ
jgi:hypothetical protein